MSKYLGEQLALQENPRTIIVRTSWLYGGEIYNTHERIDDIAVTKRGIYKNFVNTMLRLSETQTEINVISDQYGIPTSCIDLSEAISDVIANIKEEESEAHIFHFSNSCE